MVVAAAGGHNILMLWTLTCNAMLATFQMYGRGWPAQLAAGVGG